MKHLNTVAIAAILASVVGVSAAVFVPALGDNGNGQNKDCVSQEQVQAIVNEQIQNVTQATENKTIDQVISVINSTNTLDNDTKTEIISQIQNITAVEVSIDKNETASDNGVLTFTMNTTGIASGNYDLVREGKTVHELDVRLADGIPAGVYNVTKIN